LRRFLLKKEITALTGLLLFDIFSMLVAIVFYWLLVIGYWLLVIGYWLTVNGYWLLVNG